MIFQRAEEQETGKSLVFGPSFQNLRGQPAEHCQIVPGDLEILAEALPRRSTRDLARDHGPVQLILAGKVTEDQSFVHPRPLRDLSSGCALESLPGKQTGSNVENLLATISRRESNLRGRRLWVSVHLLSDHLLVNSLDTNCQAGGTARP